MTNRITSSLIKAARRAHARRQRALGSKVIQTSDNELRLAINYLAGSGLCDAAVDGDHGLVSMTAAQEALINPLEVSDGA